MDINQKNKVFDFCALKVKRATLLFFYIVQFLFYLIVRTSDLQVLDNVNKRIPFASKKW